MDRSLYIAMTGASQTLAAQTANSNNLANANTTGFRKDLEQFRSMPVFGPGHPTRVYAMAERPATDLTPGSLQTTGRDLDVAINGDGFLAIEGRDGQEAYTRAGDLQLTPDGQLLTGNGYPVLGNNGPISIPPAQKIQVGRDGTISIVPVGQPSTAQVVVDQIKLVNPDKSELVKGTDGLLRISGGGSAPQANDVRLVGGALESSNVNTVEAMVNMIELARHFETQMKMMHAVDDNTAASARLLRASQ